MLRSLEEDMYWNNPEDIFEKYYQYISSLPLPRKSIEKGQQFFRARKGCIHLQGEREHCKIICKYPYYGKQIQAPPPLLATGGRFNREGTSFLYLASSEETCVAEIHLEVNQICSIAKFHCLRKGEYLNLRPRRESCSPEVKELYDILTQPIHSEIKNKYFVTQFLSDSIRRLNFRGIIFESTQSDGENIISYYPSDYAMVEFSEKMYRAVKVEYSIEPVREEYEAIDNCGYFEESSFGQDKENVMEHIHRRMLMENREVR